jgi:hypothetical protein
MVSGDVLSREVSLDQQGGTEEVSVTAAEPEEEDEQQTPAGDAASPRPRAFVSDISQIIDVGV